LIEKAIKILDDNKYFFTLTKRKLVYIGGENKVWEKMGEKKEAWANKVGLVTLLTID